MSSSATLALYGEAPRQVKKTLDEELNELKPESFPLERYKPIGKLGAGGGGAVYLCFDQHLRKNVAVKISYARLDDELVNFQSEARVTAKFQHPNIVSIIDFGLTPSGAPFMVLEYVDGKSLDKYISELGHVEEQVAIPLFEQIASALAQGHESGIFHRDIKSSNIIITHEGKHGHAFARIIDFGIAMMSGQETTKFHGKNIIGTPKYMSPDQLSGRTFDARSEIYSFGIVMYETLTGSLPFVGDPLTLLDMHTKVAPPTFATIAPDVSVSPYMERLVRRCLEKDPDRRFNSMKDLVIALGHADGDDVIESSSIQTALDPGTFASLNKNGSSSTGGDSDAAARRIAFDEESRKRALTDDGTARNAGSQSDQSGHGEQDVKTQKKSELIIALVAVALVAIVGFLGVSGYMLLKQDGDSSSNVDSGVLNGKSNAKSSTADSAEDWSSLNEVSVIEEKAAHLDGSHQYKEAEAGYSRAIALLGNSDRLHRLRGLARKHQGKYTEALSDFNEANRIHDIDPDNIRVRAEHYLDCAQYDKALKEINYGVDLHPGNLSILLLKARIMISMNTNPVDVEKVLNKAVEVSPESGLAHALRSQIYSQEKRTVEAERELDKAVEFTGDDPFVYYYRSAFSRKKNDLDHAMTYMNKAIKLAPYMWQAYTGRSSIHNAKGDDDKASEDFEMAMTVNPQNPDICAAAASHYIYTEQAKEARRALDKAIELNPHPRYYEMRAETNLHMGKHAEAARDCENAIRLGSRGARVYRFHGAALSSLGRYKEAEAAFSKSLADTPKYINALAQRAQVYEKLGQDQKALVDYTAALKLAPNDIRCRQRRADLYDRLGKPDLAKKDRSGLPKDYGNLFNSYHDKGE